MKTLFRVLALGIFLTAFSTVSFAQEDLATLFERFKTEAKAKCGERNTSLATGKAIVEKFSSDELNKDVIEFVKKRMATIEKEDPECRRNNAYNEAFKTKNWAQAFTVGKEIIAAPETKPGVALDVMLDLVSIGYDRAAVDKVNTYNADTMSLAKTSLERIQSGTASSTGKYGVFVPFNTKEDTQSWLNYIIGWQMYNQNNQQKDALAYFYKAAQTGAKRSDTAIYTTIGKFYFDEAVRLDTEYREKRKANNNEETDETKALLALARGTADRAADAFGRAYKMATKPDQAQLKAGIGKTLTDLYKFRFNTAEAKQADVDKYIADLVAKPMPDPATAVTPVIEAAPTTATTSATTPNTTLNTTNATNTAAASTTTTATTKTPTTTKAPAKKPVTKKKGTR